MNPEPTVPASVTPLASHIGEIFIQGLEEIVSRSGVFAILGLVNLDGLRGRIQGGSGAGKLTFTEIAQVQNGLELMYGPRGGRGVALRAGRSAFKYMLRQYGTEMGVVDLNFRLLPVPVRLRTGLEALGTQLERIGDEVIVVSEQDTAWVWEAQRCPICAQRHTRSAACHFTVGLLQEFMSWASSGRVYSVNEVECLAAQPAAKACRFVIDKKALD